VGFYLDDDGLPILHGFPQIAIEACRAFMGAFLFCRALTVEFYHSNNSIIHQAHQNTANLEEEPKA
jgi:hypothetical protein